jgi:hypothetical protein
MPFKGSKYEDRRDAAAEAKKALIERFKARPPADDPAVLARAAERKAIQEAREIRAAERARLKAERKAARDAKYAARKARK